MSAPALEHGVKKRPSLAMLKKEVHRLYGTNGKDDEDEAFQAGVVLLSSAFLGPSVSGIAKFTKIPQSTVWKFATNLRASGIWSGRKVYADWFVDEGGTSFICDTLVAQGLLKRT